ncbi:phosphonoacetaldehyde hydrolase [Paenibacillus yanchengensis]|uniref:Phosphonoacetaldehyde hydrolase n=1 Tax=Paenibacillus yanchengensis TaxID=2035833 RepID=A0ABW4YHF1_9BACL
MTNTNNKQVQAVIFDWAGTTVDFGCFAPLAAFMGAFEKKGIHVTDDEVRGPMGMKKKDHVRALTELDTVKQQFVDKFGRQPNEQDIDDIYADFEPMLMNVLSNHTDVIPGVLDLVSNLRSQGIKIGSTTGYTSEMMKVVTVEAAAKGYKPDYFIASDEVPYGRPAPYMCYKNAIELELFPLETCIKVGDTVSDILEGVNAGMWSVGVICGGSEFGLTEDQMNKLDVAELEQRKQVVRDRFIAAGAHFTIESIAGVTEIVALVNEKLQNNQFPQTSSIGGAN